MKESPNLVSRMKNGEFIKSVQLDPPEESRFDELLHDVSLLRQAGVTVFDINGSRRDCMDPFDVASRLSKDKQIELIPHITARDAALDPILKQIKKEYTQHDVRNVLVITGDRYKPLADGTPDPRNIFQTKSVGIIGSIDRSLNQNGERNVLIAAAVDQNTEHVQRETNRLKAKDRQGTDFFMSQTVFDISQAQKAHEFYNNKSEKPLIIGVWPITTSKTVDAIQAGNIKGVVLPEETYQKADNLRDDPEGLRNWGIEEAAKTARYIKEYNLAQGIYVVAPLRQPSQLIPLMEKIRDL